MRKLWILVGLVLLVVLIMPARQARAAVYVVNSTSGGFDGGCTPQHCTLWAAIHAANVSAGTDVITFDLEGAGPYTITPEFMPKITDPVLINGTTVKGYKGAPLIEVNAIHVDIPFHFVEGSSGSGVLALVINNYTNAAIKFEQTQYNIVKGCYLGTNVSGTKLDEVDDWNGRGIYLVGSSHNLIGGWTDSERNLIGGNHFTGIMVRLESHYNMIIGNTIGIDFSGQLLLANGQGIIVYASSHNNIQGNLITGNTGDGIQIVGSDEIIATENLVTSNVIGSENPAGLAPMGNGRNGVQIGGNAEFNQIGTYGGNIIAYNGDTGVMMYTLDWIDQVHDIAYGNSVQNNSIHHNQELGIDHEWDGVTLNDVDDADGLANNQQNFPVISTAIGGGSDIIHGSLNSAPEHSFRLEFFKSEKCDPSGYGEGEIMLGSMDITTDAGGNATFSTPSLADFAVGEALTATATDLQTGDTSEFSKCYFAKSGVIDKIRIREFIEKIFIEIDMGDPAPFVVADLSAILNEALRAVEVGDPVGVVAQMVRFSEAVTGYVRSGELDRGLGARLIEMAEEVISEVE